MSTWCDAIEAGHLVTFPGLSSAQVRKHFPHCVATYMGHLDQTRQEHFSTKHNSRDLYIKVLDDVQAPTIPHRPSTVYSDPTGRFITKSSQGNNYILVIFDTDSNYIFAEPMPSRSANQILQAYDKVHTLLTSRGIRPTLHVMDNEISDLLKSYITRNQSQYQLVAPNQHRANAAERAIRTFKNHCISTLCSCDPNFPMHLWDRLLEQAVITFNLLRTSTINNRLSAYAQLHGTFNFDATPLGPTGTKVIIHEKPQQRGTRAPHGVEGWYIGPSMDHYRNFTVYVSSTRSIRITDTLAWLPTKVIMPTTSSTEMAMAAAFDLTQALAHPSPASALSPLTDQQRHALTELATIFGTLTNPINRDTTEPRVEPTEPRVEASQDSTRQPQFNHFPDTNSESQATQIDSTQPRVKQTDVSYTSYNHNSAQRRRQEKSALRPPKYNRRHRNPLVTDQLPKNVSTHEPFCFPTTPNPNIEPIEHENPVTGSPPSTISPSATSLEAGILSESTIIDPPRVQFNDSPTVIPPAFSPRD